ncbi:MAG TPA: hypothetical protein VJ521_14495 [Acidobacteriota bacterium]|nr:hypothetical protein [Acidobacteriota bacterium]
MTEEVKKKKKKISPTQLTLARLRKNGSYMAEVVEKWNRWGGPIGKDGQRVGNRVDLFNFIDVLAVVPGQVGTLGIQACAASSLSTRIRKVMDDPVLRQRAKWYVAAGNRLLFWGWKQNKKTKRWEVKERDFADEMDARKSAEPGGQSQLLDATTKGKDHDPF